MMNNLKSQTRQTFSSEAVKVIVFIKKKEDEEEEEERSDTEFAA